MAKENLAVRDRGYEDDDVRGLMAAMCLRACVDFRNAHDPKYRETKDSERTIKDCHEFFGGDIFQFFTNGMPVKEIEKMILASPAKSVLQIWRAMENKQAKKNVD